MPDVLENLETIAIGYNEKGWTISERIIRDGIAEIERLRGLLVGTDVGSNAARDVIVERRRQVEAEGWSPEHDDSYREGEIPAAAGVYALVASGRFTQCLDIAKRFWPWDMKWWKPKDPRRMLVKAAALILAEIERLDRAALQEGAR